MKKFMRKLLILTTFLLCFFNPGTLFSEDIVISVDESVYSNFKRWTEKKSVFDINNFNTIYSERGTIEFILLHQILKASGDDFTVRYITTSNKKKEMYLVTSGVAHIAAQCIWDRNVNSNDYNVTSPVLAKGDYEKGIYALSKSKVRSTVKSVEDLRKFKAVVTESQNPDNDTLKAMGIKHILEVTHPEDIYYSIYHRKSDFVLLDFSENNDFRYSALIEVDKKYGNRTVKIKRKVRIFPVENIKIGLQGSLHYITTKKSTNSEMIFQSLEKGIKAMRENRVFKKAFTEGKVLNYRVVDWKQIF